MHEQALQILNTQNKPVIAQPLHVKSTRATVYGAYPLPMNEEELPKAQKNLEEMKNVARELPALADSDSDQSIDSIVFNTEENNAYSNNPTPDTSDEENDSILFDDANSTSNNDAFSVIKNLNSISEYVLNSNAGNPSSKLEDLDETTDEGELVFTNQGLKKLNTKNEEQEKTSIKQDNDENPPKKQISTESLPIDIVIY